jgi:hypothetical protein
MVQREELVLGKYGAAPGSCLNIVGSLQGS